MNRAADKNNILMSFSQGAYATGELIPEHVELVTEIAEEIGTHAEQANSDYERVTLRASGVGLPSICGSDKLFRVGALHPLSEPVVALTGKTLSGGLHAFHLWQEGRHVAAAQRTLAERVLVDGYKAALSRLAESEPCYILSHHLPLAYDPCHLYESSKSHKGTTSVFHIIANDEVYPKEDEVKIRPLSEATAQRKRRPVIRAASMSADDKEAAMNLVMGAARRVMRQHDKELEALAKK